MARITVEDCFKRTERFSLIILASRRVRDIENGAPVLVDRDGDKNPVVALREIAADLLDLQEIENNIVRTFRKSSADEPLDDMILDEDPAVPQGTLEVEVSETQTDDEISVEEEPEESSLEG